MAGDWIKMRGNLWDDPRVSKLCDLTGCGEAQIIGGLYWLWATADQHTEDGCMPGLTLRQIDRKTGIQGFGAALCDGAVGWLRDDPAGVVILRFKEHNGTSAKRRCTDAQRKAGARSVSASHADNSQTDDGVGEDEKRRLSELEKEKRREEEKERAIALSSAKPTIPCPYQAIVDLYHDRLPMLPRVKLMPASRQKAMRKLWGWVLSSSKSDGSRRAESADAALEWVGSYFARASENDWLAGRAPRGAAHENWKCDLDFLLTEKGMKHVIEKTAEVAA